MQTLVGMKSAGNRGVFQSSLQAPHIHVLLAAPLSAGNMAQPGTDQHESGVAIRERARHPGAAADFPVEPFYDIIGTNTSPVFAGKIAVGKRFFNAIFYLPGSLFQFHGTQFLHHGFCLLPGSLLVLLGMDRLEHLRHQLYLGTRRYREHVAVSLSVCTVLIFFITILRHPDKRLSIDYGLCFVIKVCNDLGFIGKLSDPVVPCPSRYILLQFSFI